MTTIEQLKDKLKKLTSRWYYSKEEIDNSFVDNTSFNSSISNVYNTFYDYQTITMGYGTSYQNKNVVTDNTGKITVEEKPTIPSKISDLNNDSNFIETSNTNGLIKNDGTIDTNTYSQTNHTHSTYLTDEGVMDKLGEVLDDMIDELAPYRIKITNFGYISSTLFIMDYTSNFTDYTDQVDIERDYSGNSISFDLIDELPLENMMIGILLSQEGIPLYFYNVSLDDADENKLITVDYSDLPQEPPTS